MNATTYSDINHLLDSLLASIRAALGSKLVGLYLYGSLVWGDFDYDISDIDLMAATAGDIDEKEFALLEAIHNDFARNNPVWDNRLEIAYISTQALRTFKTQSSSIAIISPGEPFHLKEAGRDWLINWYVVQEKGLTLYGPAPQTLIEPISKEEFLQAVKAQAAAWREYVIHTRSSRPYQGYAILTLCRALYAYENGEQVSKQQAALWAQQRLPGWAPLIRDALKWRQDYRNKPVDPAATYPQTVKFVEFVIDQIVKA